MFLISFPDQEWGLWIDWWVTDAMFGHPRAN